MSLAQPVFDPPHLTGWYVGLVIGFLAVVAIVAIVAAILTSAARIARQSRTAIVVLDEAREHTLPLWRLQAIERVLRDLATAAESVRTSLESRR